MEDLQQGVGPVTQSNRSGNAIDVPIAVTSLAQMKALDVTIWTRARVYTDATVYTDYIYDPADNSGEQPNEGTGSWVIPQIFISAATEITTLQLLSSMSGLTVVNTSGFYTVGDNGGGKWVPTGVTGLTPMQLPIDLMAPKLTDAAGNEWRLVYSGLIELAQLGVNESIDDIGPYVQLANDDIGLGGELRLPAGTLHQQTSFELGSETTLSGEEGCTVSIDANITPITASGSINTSQANLLAADTTFGARSVTLQAGKGANFFEGQWCLVKSEAAGPGAAINKNGELARVDSVAGDVITFNGPLLFSYTTADSAEVQTLALQRDITVKDIEYVNPDPANNAQIVATILLSQRVLFENVTVRNNRNSVFQFQGCVACKVSKCNALDLRSQITSVTGFGYMVVEAGPNRGFTMSQCYAEQTRHAYTTVEGKNVNGVTIDYGVPSSSRIMNCHSETPLAAGFDTHDDGIDIQFIGCTVRGGRREGFQTRAVDVRLNSCDAFSCTSGGFTFSESLRASAENCKAYKTNSGIDPETSVDWTTRGAFYNDGAETKISNCQAVEVGGHGFEIGSAAVVTYPKIHNCEAVNVGIATASRGFYSRNANSTIVEISDCKALSYSGNMNRGFDSASSTPELILTDSIARGYTDRPVNGAWNKLGVMNAGGTVSYGITEDSTISSGTLDIENNTSSVIRVNGEGGSNDDLENISTISTGNGDSFILIKGTGNITVKHNVGNIRVDGGADHLLNSSTTYLKVLRIGSTYIVQPVIA